MANNAGPGSSGEMNSESEGDSVEAPLSLLLLIARLYRCAHQAVSSPARAKSANLNPRANMEIKGC